MVTIPVCQTLFIFPQNDTFMTDILFTCVLVKQSTGPTPVDVLRRSQYLTYHYIEWNFFCSVVCITPSCDQDVRCAPKYLFFFVIPSELLLTHLVDSIKPRYGESTVEPIRVWSNEITLSFHTVMFGMLVLIGDAFQFTEY